MWDVVMVCSSTLNRDIFAWQKGVKVGSEFLVKQRAGYYAFGNAIEQLIREGYTVRYLSEMIRLDVKGIRQGELRRAEATRTAEATACFYRAS